MRDFLQFSLARKFDVQQERLERHIGKVLSDLAHSELQTDDRLKHAQPEAGFGPWLSGDCGPQPVVSVALADNGMLPIPRPASAEAATSTPREVSFRDLLRQVTEMHQREIARLSEVASRLEMLLLAGEPRTPRESIVSADSSVTGGASQATRSQRILPGDAPLQGRPGELELDPSAESPAVASEGRAPIASLNSLERPPSANTGEASTPVLNTHYQWEWERSNNKGWRPYTRSENFRIEIAWRSGLSRVRVRSGVEGRTPLEIFFVDMLQHDPQSLNNRRIRRVGHLQWWRRPLRCFRAIFNQVRTGEPRWETFEAYQARQAASVRRIQKVSTAVSSSSRCSKRERALKLQAPIRYKVMRVARSELFMLTSMIVTVSNALWILYDTDKNVDMVLYEKPTSTILVECLFCLFFSAELVIRLLTYLPWTECLRSVSFVFDAACVAGSVLEVIVLPTFDFLSDRSFRHSRGWAVLRNVRVLRALRVCRIFNAFEDTWPFFQGLLSGMRNSLVVWGLLVVLLFIFGLLLRLNAKQSIADLYFRTAWDAMVTLAARGIMLDEVSEIVHDMRAQDDKFSFIMLTLFVFVAHFNLLNMLIGTFCSVAEDRAAEEKEADRVRFLHRHLEDLLDCYIAEEGCIGKAEFELIMKNADFHYTLRQAGTDMESLRTLQMELFHGNDDITFDELFLAITHIRKGRVATVKDVLRIHHALTKSFRLLESLESGFERIGRWGSLSRPP